jgi:hypothetical protein
MLMTFGQISMRRCSLLKSEIFSNKGYFCPMKFVRRFLAVFALLAVAFQAVGSFLSWAQRQEDAPADAWIDEDEDELEDA